MKRIIAGWFLLCAAAFAQPTISAVYVQSSTATTATIVWTTSTPATSQILYGYNIALPFSNSKNPSLVTSHSMTLTVLNSVQPYYFAVVSVDSTNHSAQSSTYQFALCGAPFAPVSGSINQFYYSGTYSITWNPPSGSVGSPTVCGQAVTTPVTGSLNLSGTFSTQVADALKVTPGPGTWTVAVEDIGDISPISVTLPLSASFPDISSQLQDAAAATSLVGVIANNNNHTVYPPWLSGGGGGGVTAVTATLPLSSTGGVTPNLTCAVASASRAGCLAQADFITFAAKSPAFTLTTTGTSGAATYLSNVINIPQYGAPFTLTTSGTSGAATYSGNVINIPVYSSSSGSGTVSASTVGQGAWYNGTTTVQGINGAPLNVVAAGAMPDGCLVSDLIMSQGSSTFTTTQGASCIAVGKKLVADVGTLGIAAATVAGTGSATLSGITGSSCLFTVSGTTNAVAEVYMTGSGAIANGTQLVFFQKGAGFTTSVLGTGVLTGTLTNGNSFTPGTCSGSMTATVTDYFFYPVTFTITGSSGGGVGSVSPSTATNTAITANGLYSEIGTDNAPLLTAVFAEAQTTGSALYFPTSPTGGRYFIASALPAGFSDETIYGDGFFKTHIDSALTGFMLTFGTFNANIPGDNTCYVEDAQHPTISGISFENPMTESYRYTGSTANGFLGGQLTSGIQVNGERYVTLDHVQLAGLHYGYEASYCVDYSSYRAIWGGNNDVTMYLGPGSQQWSFYSANLGGGEGLVLANPGPPAGFGDIYLEDPLWSSITVESSQPTRLGVVNLGGAAQGPVVGRDFWIETGTYSGAPVGWNWPEDRAIWFHGNVSGYASYPRDYTFLNIALVLGEQGIPSGYAEPHVLADFESGTSDALGNIVQQGGQFSAISYFGSADHVATGGYANNMSVKNYKPVDGTTAIPVFTYDPGIANYQQACNLFNNDGNFKPNTPTVDFRCGLSAFPTLTTTAGQTNTLGYNQWAMGYDESANRLTYQYYGASTRQIANLNDFNVVLPNTIYSAAGTPLPTCNAAEKGGRAIVSDATSGFTYFGSYTSGGTLTAQVVCSYNGTTYSWLMD